MKAFERDFDRFVTGMENDLFFPNHHAPGFMTCKKVEISYPSQQGVSLPQGKEIIFHIADLYEVLPTQT